MLIKRVFTWDSREEFDPVLRRLSKTIAGLERPRRVGMLLADIVERCVRDRRTGLLSISVAQSTQFSVRIYMDRGRVGRFSYGPLLGRECIDMLQHYRLVSARYIEGMQPPSSMEEELTADEIITSLRKMGKTVHLEQWIERGGTSHAGIY